MVRTMDTLKLYKLYRETLLRVEVYSKRVAENKDLDGALEFAKFVYWSGILELLEAIPEPSEYPVNGPMLRARVKELQESVQERYSKNDAKPHISTEQFLTLHEKMDAIIQCLSSQGLMTVRLMSSGSSENGGQHGVHDHQRKRQRLVAD